MNIEKIIEPVRVVASFAGGGCEPLKFDWKNRSYPVEQVNGRWIDRQGGVFRLHYSVQSGGQTYYLHFATDEVQWWLDEVIVQ